MGHHKSHRKGAPSRAFGILLVLGMILAIPLTAFLASLWRLIRDKYVAELI